MIRIGSVEITRIEEILLPEPSSLFAAWRPEIARDHAGWLGRSFYDPDADTFVSSIHAWLIRAGGHTILVDTCGGNGKSRPASPRFDRLDLPFLKRLREAGVEPEDVDAVVNTHLHVDHVGWNTRLEGEAWVPTFPNATYYLPRTECELRDPERGAREKPPGVQQPFRDSVRPVLDAARVVLVDGHETLFEGIDLMPIPGHAPGQVAVRVRSEGKEALFVADVMHQPVQVYHTDWNSKYCEDQDLARRTRRSVLDYAADTGCLLLPGHFGHPHCIHVDRDGDGYRLRFPSGAP